MSTPIYDRLENRLAVRIAEPVKPISTLLIGVWMIWCPACEDSDFMHEHEDDPRCARVGDPALLPTVGEARWINDHNLSPFTGGYQGPFRESTE